jgi:hypothetical protein
VCRNTSPSNPPAPKHNRIFMTLRSPAFFFKYLAGMMKRRIFGSNDIANVERKAPCHFSIADRSIMIVV